MVGLVARVRQASGKPLPTGGAANGAYQLPQAPSEAFTRSFLISPSASTASQTSTGVEASSDESDESTVSRTSGPGVTYQDLDEWRSRASKGELHFYSCMTNAGAISGRMLFLPRLERDMLGVYGLQPYEWTTSERLMYEADATLPKTLSTLDPAAMPATVSYHVSRLGSTRNNGPMVSYKDFLRLDTALAANRLQLIVWSLSDDGLADYSPVLVIWSPMIKFTEQQRQSFLNGYYNDQKAPGLGKFLTDGSKISDFLVDSQAEYFRLCAA
ncbi:MAG: hypothetical protein M1828_003895 [Chrysothrix sp. TS-e1954]|nr:MAG: hypothetical protein M1828_003895 [Chrysothrix sp. TS-e1954]